MKAIYQMTDKKQTGEGMNNRNDFDIVDIGETDEAEVPVSPEKSSRWKRWIFQGCLVVGILCLLVGAGIFIKVKVDEKKVREQMEVLRNQVELDEVRRQQEEAVKLAEAAEETVVVEPEESVEAESEAEEPEKVENPYKSVFQENEDMAAWIQIEGTVIDYPVMQTMEDENYYLKRGFDGKSNENGCLILDTDSRIIEPLSTNLIIHGHNMKSGEMFGTLTEYEDEAYFEEHRYISLYTKECRRNYEIIAVFRSQVYRKTDEVFKFYQFFQADVQEEFDVFYDNIMEMSLYDTGVSAEFGDRFLTLSTCVYHVENGRFVVVAREMETGDCYEAY